MGLTAGVQFPGGMRKGFFLVTTSRLALGPTQTPIRWIPGALYPRMKLPGHEVDH